MATCQGQSHIIVAITCINGVFRGKLWFTANSWRQILFNICGIISLTQLPPRHACSLAACTVYFLHKTDQTEKVFDPKRWAPGRDNDEWIFGSDVRPLQRYGRLAPFRVVKKNATTTCDSSYTVDLKPDISIGMERVGDLEGFAVKILMRRSWTMLLWTGSSVAEWHLLHEFFCCHCDSHGNLLSVLENWHLARPPAI